MKMELVAAFLLVLTSVSGRSQAEVLRWSVDSIECPKGTDLRRAEDPDSSLSAQWCEIRRGSKVAPHGPYLELYADRTTARQGQFLRGAQVGQWITWTREGEIETTRTLWAGESGRHIPRPEDLCPPGSIRDRSRVHNHRRHGRSHCYTKDEKGERILVGPYVTWDEEKAPEGGRRYVLRQIMTYRDDERHGPHRVFEGPFGREVLVEEETFFEGYPEGESLAFFRDGKVRERRFYRDGQFDGERIGYHPNGRERWRVVYEGGHRVASDGDLTVAGKPCPQDTVPTTSADGREEVCARRYLHFLERKGPFLERDEAGQIVESGLYKRNEKVELWQAPPGVELPPEVADDELVAEIELLVGDRLFKELSSRPPPARNSRSFELGSAEPTPQAETATEAITFQIWFKNTATRKHPHPRTIVREGVVEIYGLPPGRYYMGVEVDANPSNEMQWPGDLTSAKNFKIVAGEIGRLSTQLLYTIRLIEPRDNNEPIPGFRYPCRNKEAILPNPLRFSWLPPGGEEMEGQEYAYKVTRRSCDSNRLLEVIAKGKTRNTGLELSLPPSQPGEVFEWTLSAKVRGRSVGTMMTFGQDGYGWSLRFRTE